jgi:hypothetical protein
MRRRIALFAFAFGIVSIALAPAAARADVPVHIRIIKGSKAGPAKMDAKLEVLKKQLSALAYVRWEEESDEQRTMSKGKIEFFKLPNGDDVSLQLQDEQSDKVTFEVVLLARKTKNKLTVERGQRIVHQVSGEKDGSAFFLTVIVWPDAR